MNFIDKIIDKLNLSFEWSRNRKKIIRQSGEGIKVNNEQSGVTNIFQIENLTVTAIQELTGYSPDHTSSGFMNNAGRRFLLEQKAKQENLSAIVNEASLSKIESPKSVDPGWFLRWMDISQTVSKHDIRTILAKILSAEVTISDSFSLRTLDVVKNLSKDELELFQIFCNISFSIPVTGDSLTCVICEPFGNPGDNGLIDLGLSYTNLTTLQDAGLIKSDLNSWIQFSIPLMLQLPFTLGSSQHALVPTSETTEVVHQVKILNFTAVGIELRSVMQLDFNETYDEKFFNWIDGKWHMVKIEKK